MSEPQQIPPLQPFKLEDMTSYNQELTRLGTVIGVSAYVNGKYHPGTVLDTPPQFEYLEDKIRLRAQNVPSDLHPIEHISLAFTPKSVYINMYERSKKCILAFSGF